LRCGGACGLSRTRPSAETPDLQGRYGEITLVLGFPASRISDSPLRDLLAGALPLVGTGKSMRGSKEPRSIPTGEDDTIRNLARGCPSGEETS
jgi:hypothetical protein